MAKDKQRKREIFDIAGLQRHITSTATVMEPSEYTEEKMPIYAANINLRRQIPEIKDGLLPVQRRILITLYLNHIYKGRLTKSVQVVGDVSKKLHPHGDSSIYNAMICMGQPWRNNVCMISRKGNYGSAYNSDGYAHMRYTESSMSDFAYDCFFADWKLTNPSSDMVVDWISNYDDSGLEPMYLPAKYPTFLLTWRRSMGIGRYCGLIGFNVTDAFGAVIKLIKDPDDDFIIYPDDPEGCDLINAKDFKGVLDKTDVTAKMRGTYVVNHYDGHDHIEITSTPFEVDPKNIVDAVVKHASDNKFPEISDIQGYSDDFGKGFIITIEVRKGYDPDAVVSKIYKYTQLENTYIMKYSFVNGLQSVDYTLRIAILEWIRGRREVLKRIHKSRLIWVIKRKFFLEPLIKVIESGQIDEFIKIVRTNTEKDAIQLIMNKWSLADYQAEKIIDVKISDLSKDKLPGYKDEVKNLRKEEAELTELVNNHHKLDEIIIRDMEEGISKYGKPRKSRVTQLIDAIHIPDTIHYLIFTNKYIKKLPYDERGYRIGKIDTNERVLKVIVANNRDTLAIFTNDGRCTPVKVNDIPNSNTQSVGISYTQCGTKDTGFVDAINISEETLEKKALVTVTTKGLISKTDCADIEGKEKSFAFMKIDKGDSMAAVCMAYEDDKIIVFTKSGKASIFPFDDFENTAANTKGVQSCKLDDGDSIIGVSDIRKNYQSLVILTDRGYVKKINISNMPNTKRNGRTIEINSSYGQLMDVKAVSENLENPLFICTTMGSFILDHANIRATNRIGKPERAAVLELKDYAFELLYK